ncbi:hypothetical protein S100390_v1c09760 [Spiroplasma sp. NBRC 100390]|uniref:hypothetical protein n=1 Tax=unclassified Spiroplasma TaxID=2637901 RepID=UPI00089297A2|nr:MULTISPECIES: hypothetical protein [unclassified Spiroplasma]AOX44312.1 hypothetical protein STU14_v1c09760 [Spiroplasma sp. TU-14]APE13782.1 hypothetical protein S100390_v1c09760 [Spiroplasma sp. NBRC 100390]
MKKLLVILGVFDVSVVSPNLLTSCVIKPIISQIDNGIDYQGDLRILNEITKKISTMLQKYAIEKTLIDINDYSIQEFEKLFTMMTSNKTQEELKLDDKNIAAALNALVNGFMAVFNNVNRDVANQYSNYYINTMPLKVDEKDYQFMLNYIDVTKLGSLVNVDVNNLKGVRLDFRVEVKIQFKTLETRVPFLIQYIITNDKAKMEEILTAVTGAVSKAIVKFFNSMEENIIVDQNSAFQSIYNNFDLNYASDHSMLDAIVQRELDAALHADNELGEIRNSITYAKDEQILVLLNSIINPDTNGVTPVIPDDETYTWVNTGYAPEKLTPENFLEYYGEKLSILTSTSDSKLQLGQFRINLAKILVAGVPLSGVILNQGRPFYLSVGITRDGMIEKIKNFGRIISTFYQYYKITWDIKVWKEGALFLDVDFWNGLEKQVKDEGLSHRKIWRILLNKFKNDPQNKGLPDIDKFWITTEIADLVPVIGSDRSLSIYANRNYSLRFNFGVNATTNNIYYTPWPVNIYGIAFKPSDYVYPKAV